MLKEIQRLRYDVYCLERGFLDANDFSEQRESDAYDDHAVHCAAMDIEGQVSGTLRLVLDSPLGFPLEGHAQALDEQFRALPRDRTAEISRLAVAKNGRQLRKSGDFREYPLLLFQLFRDMNLESARLGLDYWLAAMEPTLHRLIRRLLGFEFVQIGPPMEYYGEVVPYVASIDAIARSLERRRPDLFEYFGFAGLMSGIQPADLR